MTMGEFLKKQRAEAGLSQTQAAVSAGMSISTVLKLELDKPVDRMNVRTIGKLFDLYKCKLVFGVDNGGSRRILFDADS